MAVALILGFFVLLNLAMLMLAGGVSMTAGTFLIFAMVMIAATGALVGVRNLLDET